MPTEPGELKRLDSLTGAARFQAVMAVRPCARSAHFMMHHLAAVQLSTAPPDAASQAVDDPVVPAFSRLGMVVPKRHARRAVTRNLVKREMRAGMGLLGDSLPPGDWVLRLRAPFDRQRYVSAASAELAADVRAELSSLIADALRHAARARPPSPAQVPHAAA